MGAVGIGWRILLAVLLVQTIFGEVFDCRVGVARRHIPLDWVCDNVDDCENGFDEANCTYRHSCDKGEMVCGDTCISQYYKCDGEVDCLLGSDERHCDSFDISHLRADHQAPIYIPIECKEFKCKTGGQCVTHDAVCDGMKDCPDGDDEEDCHSPKSLCPFGHVKCAGEPLCIPRYWKCDKAEDCENGSDEVGCTYADGDVPRVPSSHCSRDEYQCAGTEEHTCISQNRTCDGIRDCPLGDDERFYCQTASDSDGSLFISLGNEVRTTFLFNASHREYRRAILLNYTALTMDYNHQRKLLLATMSHDFHNSSTSLATIDEVGWTEILLENVVGLGDVVWDTQENNIYYTQQHPAKDPGITVCEARLIFCRRIIHGRIAAGGTRQQAYRGLALDPSRGYLYWIEGYGGNYEIKKAKLDGSGPETVIGEKLLKPTELTLDQERNDLYFADFGTFTLEKINLDSGERHVAITEGVHQVVMVKYFNKILYWMDAATRTLKATDVRDKATVTRHFFNRNPLALAINHSAYQMIPEQVPREDCLWIRVTVPTNISRLQSSCLCPDEYSIGGSCAIPLNGSWPLILAKGYLARLCQEGSLCQNGGSCSQKGGTATVCHCPSGYYGKACEMETEATAFPWKLVLAFFLLVVLAGVVGSVAQAKCAGLESSASPPTGAVLPLIDDSVYNRFSNPNSHSFNNPSY